MKKLPSKVLWIGEHRQNPVLKNRKHDFIMDSAINYYQMESPKLSYEPGCLFLDSGAFTATMRDFKLDREKVVNVQEQLYPDLVIPLDFPFKPGMSTSFMEKLWKKTQDNIVYWQDNSSLSGKTVPTLHSYDRDSLIHNIDWLKKYTDSEYIAVGVIVNPEFTGYNGFFKDRQPRRELIKMLSISIEVIRQRTDFKIHIMGLGSSPLMLHLAYYMSVDSTDSSGFRRKAAFGKIILPGSGERYVGTKKGNFGRKYMTKHELELLSECQCKVCSSDQSQLWRNWKARAIHNEYVMKEETRIARELMSKGLDAYEAHLDKIFSMSKYGLEYLWRYAKLLKKYKKLTDILR